MDWFPISSTPNASTSINMRAHMQHNTAQAKNIRNLGALRNEYSFRTLSFYSLCLVSPIAPSPRQLVWPPIINNTSLCYLYLPPRINHLTYTQTQKRTQTQIDTHTRTHDARRRTCSTIPATTKAKLFFSTSSRLVLNIGCRTAILSSFHKNSNLFTFWFAAHIASFCGHYYSLPKPPARDWGGGLDGYRHTKPLSMCYCCLPLRGTLYRIVLKIWCVCLRVCSAFIFYFFNGKGWLCHYLPSLVLWATTVGRKCGRRTFCHSCQHIVERQIRRRRREKSEPNLGWFCRRLLIRIFKVDRKWRIECVYGIVVCARVGRMNCGELVTHTHTWFGNIIGGMPNVCL